MTGHTLVDWIFWLTFAGLVLVSLCVVSKFAIELWRRRP